ncbi:hypothetical protein ACSSS7_000169 [Eimeria intestinalis]
MKRLLLLSAFLLSLEASPSLGSRVAVTSSSHNGPAASYAGLSGRSAVTGMGTGRVEEELAAVHVAPSYENNPGEGAVKQEAPEEVALSKTDQTEEKNMKALKLAGFYILITVVLSILVHELIVYPKALKMQEEAGEKDGSLLIDDEAAYDTVLEKDQLSSVTTLSTGLMFLASLVNFLYRLIRVGADKFKLHKLLRRSRLDQEDALQESPPLY